LPLDFVSIGNILDLNLGRVSSNSCLSHAPSFTFSFSTYQAKKVANLLGTFGFDVVDLGPVSLPLSSKAFPSFWNH